MMTTATNKPYLSVSQLSTLSRCGIQYANRYLEGRIIPPGVAATRGIGVHCAASANGKQKIHSGVDLTILDLQDIAAEAFNTQLNTDGIWLNPEEESIGTTKVLSAAKDQTVDLAAAYGDQVAAEYQPKLVEETFRIELPGPRDFLGVIDLVDDQCRVIDLKTTGRSKSQDEADKSLQLTGYAAGHQVMTGQPPSEVRLEVLVTKSKGIHRQTLLSTRDATDFDVLAARVNAAISVIEAGAFLPADPTDWCCSAKWCGYWHSCPFAGGKKR